MSYSACNFFFFFLKHTMEVPSLWDFTVFLIFYLQHPQPTLEWSPIKVLTMAQVVSNLVAQQILRIFGLAKFSLMNIPTFTKVRSGSGLKKVWTPAHHDLHETCMVARSCQENSTNCLFKGYNSI